jgi:hypothetical protein
MLDNKDYCDYETCVALKELGYVGSSRYYYTQRDHKFHYDAYNKFYTVRTADAMGYVLAIHLYEAQKWLREEKEVEVAIIPEYNEFAPVKGVQYRVWISHWKDDEFGYETIEIVDEETRLPFLYKTYEEALSEGIKEAVKVLKEK